MACRKANVRVDSIHVSKSETYGLFGGEPGASAEWDLDIIVNDQSRKWNRDGVRDGSNHTLGWDYPVDLPNDSASITIRASGVEIDDLSANDELPAAQRTHGSSDNWGIGETRQMSASDRHFNYTVFYTVTCLAES
jgi:hypothetical protein